MTSKLATEQLYSNVTSFIISFQDEKGNEMQTIFNNQTKYQMCLKSVILIWLIRIKFTSHTYPTNQIYDTDIREIITVYREINPIRF